MADYNGWTNWETWHTALLIDNERDLYEKKVELCKRKASLTEFKRSLKKAEVMTRKYAKQNARELPDTSWATEKFEKVNWNEIYKNAMAEEYN